MHFCTFIHTYCNVYKDADTQIHCMYVFYIWWITLSNFRSQNWRQKHRKHPKCDSMKHVDHPQQMIHGYPRWRWAPDPVVNGLLSFINRRLYMAFSGYFNRFYRGFNSIYTWCRGPPCIPYQSLSKGLFCWNGWDPRFCFQGSFKREKSKYP